MRITTRAVFDIESGDLLERDCSEWAGRVAEAKRGEAKSAASGIMGADQAASAAAAQKASEQVAYQKSLVDIVQQLLGGTSGTGAIGKLQEMFQKPTGFDPTALSSMRSNVIDTTSGQYNNAIESVKAMLAKRGLAGGGDSGPAAGLYGQGIGSMEAQKAGAVSSGLENADIQNAMAQLQNMWNAAGQLGQYGGLFTGVTSAFSPSPFTSAQTGMANAGANALGTYGNLWTTPTLGASVLSGLANAAGQGAAAYGGAKGSCWIAARLYGWFTPEFFAARRFIFELWKGRVARLVQRLYVRFGKRAARHRVICLILKPLFDVAVRRGFDGNAC